MTPQFIALLALVSTAPDSVPLIDGLGDYRRPISTRSQLSQRYFTQGLVLTYGFNHAEAIRAYQEAQRLDPACGICAWGEAFALGPNINWPMDSASEAQALAAVRRAQASKGGTAVERALIAALAQRYGEPVGAERATRDSAYALAMRAVAQRFPNDQDVQTLYADAMLNLRPWNQWRTDGSPQPGTLAVVAALEKVIGLNPNHPGACHLYIHTVEASRTPERAVPCAERLASLVPAAGHLVHMPAHIYVRVGRYNDAVKANEHAVHADEQYIADRGPQGLYPAMYYPHNIHFLSFAAALAGRSKLAIEAGDEQARKITEAELKLAPPLELYATVGDVMRVRFGKWDAILAHPLPPATWRFATGVAWYARGRAYAATGRLAEARAALDTVRTIGDAASPDWVMGSFHSGKQLLGIAAKQLEGAIALTEGKTARALRAYDQALVLEDSVRYDEPHPFPLPTRQALAAALLEAGRPAEAEAVYRRDLTNLPENGWALFGLVRSLEAQGKKVEAARVNARFKKAWASADVELKGSWF